MKLNIKAVFLVLVLLCLANFSLGGWWGSSSRSSSSRSSSSRRSSSRSRSSSSSFGSKSSSSGNSESKPRAHDIKTKQGLRDLYNKDVVKAERVARPLQGSLGIFGKLHSGVVVTTRDGDRKLVHKGDGYGTSRGGQTVVTDAKHMSKDWEVTDTKPVSGAKVKDYVKEGGKDYSLFKDNCNHASERMENIGSDSKKNQEDTNSNER